MKRSHHADRQLFSGLLLEVRASARALRRSPVVTTVIVLTLALGLGGATAIFGLVETVFWSALPFHEGDRLLRLRNYAVTSGEIRSYSMSARDFWAVRAGNEAFEDVVAQQGFSFSLLGAEGAERVNVTGVSPRWAETMGLEPQLGRTFTQEEADLGSDAGVALISNALWQRRFGSDPSVLGADLTLTSGTFTVIGVLQPGFIYPYDADLWVPWRWDPSNWQAHDLNVVARMRDGVSIERVEEEMARLYRGLKEAAPGTVPDSGIEVTLVRDNFIYDQAQVLRALGLAVAFLLVLACTNVANLLTAQFARRQRAISVAAALGAPRLRLVRRFVVESVLLFALGGAAAVVLTAWIGPLLVVLIPDVLRTQLNLGEVRVGPGVLAFGLGLSLLAGLLSGGAAAAQASKFDLRTVLGSKASAGLGSRRFQRSLVVAQVALAVVLLAGAGLLSVHFRSLQATDLGYDLEDLWTFRLDIAQEPYNDAEARRALLQRLQERLESVPEIAAAGVTTVNPLCCGDWGASIEVDGREPPREGAPILIHHRYVAPEYFRAMGIPLVRGRGFSSTETSSSARTVIVDESLATRFWPGEDPVGKRLRSARPGEPWRTVIGVVPTVYKEGDYTEAWYLPYYQEPLGRPTDRLHVMLRVQGEGAIPAVRAVVAEIDPALAVHSVAPMAELREELVSQERLGATVSVVFAAFGLLLAGFGLFGLLSQEVDSRAVEIGTRMALGADQARVVVLVVRQTTPLLAAGVGLGLLLTLATQRVLRSVVEGMGALDPQILVLAVAAVTAVSSAALVVPLLRAVRTEPLLALAPH